jgi:hypothetical protein
VRGKDDLRRGIELRENVEATIGDRLLDDAVPSIAKKPGEPGADFLLAARRGIDVNERAGEILDAARTGAFRF